MQLEGSDSRLKMDSTQAVSEFEELCSQTAEKWNALQLPNATLKPDTVLKHCWSADRFIPKGPGVGQNYALLGSAIFGAVASTISAFPLGLIGWPLFVAPAAIAAWVFADEEKWLKNLKKAVDDIMPELQRDFLVVIDGAESAARVIGESSAEVGAEERDQQLDRVLAALLNFVAETLYREDLSKGELFINGNMFAVSTADDLVGEALDFIEQVRVGSHDSRGPDHGVGRARLLDGDAL